MTGDVEAYIGFQMLTDSLERFGENNFHTVMRHPLQSSEQFKDGILGVVWARQPAKSESMAKMTLRRVISAAG